MERRSPVDSWLPEGFIGLLKVNSFFFFFLILRLLLQCLKQVLTCCGLGPCCFAVLCFPLCYTCTLLGNLSFLHLRWLCRCRIIEYSSLDPQGSSSPAPDSRKYLPKIKVCVWECCLLWEETPISVVLGRSCQMFAGEPWRDLMLFLLHIVSQQANYACEAKVVGRLHC